LPAAHSRRARHRSRAIVSSLACGLVHLSKPGATLICALGTAAAGGVTLSAAYLLIRNLWLAIGIHWGADFWQGGLLRLARRAVERIGQR
jgi:uncharacterized protein